MESGGDLAHPNVKSNERVVADVLGKIGVDNRESEPSSWVTEAQVKPNQQGLEPSPSLCEPELPPPNLTPTRARPVFVRDFGNVPGMARVTARHRWGDIRDEVLEAAPTRTEIGAFENIETNTMSKSKVD
jgi:hypothetical protein